MTKPKAKQIQEAVDVLRAQVRANKWGLKPAAVLLYMHNNNIMNVSDITDKMALEILLQGMDHKAANKLIKTLKTKAGV